MISVANNLSWIYKYIYILKSGYRSQSPAQKAGAWFLVQSLFVVIIVPILRSPSKVSVINDRPSGIMDELYRATILYLKIFGPAHAHSLASNQFENKLARAIGIHGLSSALIWVSILNKMLFLKLFYFIYSLFISGCWFFNSSKYQISHLHDALFK